MHKLHRISICVGVALVAGVSLFTPAAPIIVTALMLMGGIASLGLAVEWINRGREPTDEDFR